MKKIFVGLVILFIVIQFIPYGTDHTNPAITGEPAWDSPKTKILFMHACGDCHSNETKWPWYSNIAPISWFVYSHVMEGREHFNVSVWGVQKKNKGDEAVEEVEKNEMPLFSYIIAHPDAELSKEEKARFIEGLRRTFGEKKSKSE